MFPFASHAEYGYKLAPFVSEELAEAGRVAAELGHRLTTHPGQVRSSAAWGRAMLIHVSVHATRFSSKAGHR